MFFFQAEDGIRDLVRSRGLGDVYKRQVEQIYSYDQEVSHNAIEVYVHRLRKKIADTGLIAVSYTHLTLPTSDLV